MTKNNNNSSQPKNLLVGLIPNELKDSQKPWQQTKKRSFDQISGPDNHQQEAQRGHPQTTSKTMIMDNERLNEYISSVFQPHNSSTANNDESLIVLQEEIAELKNLVTTQGDKIDKLYRTLKTQSELTKEQNVVIRALRESLLQQNSLMLSMTKSMLPEEITITNQPSRNPKAGSNFSTLSTAEPSKSKRK